MQIPNRLRQRGIAVQLRGSGVHPLEATEEGLVRLAAVGAEKHACDLEGVEGRGGGWEGGGGDGHDGVACLFERGDGEVNRAADRGREVADAVGRHEADAERGWGVRGDG